jgi:hypothetical protein
VRVVEIGRYRFVLIAGRNDTSPREAPDAHLEHPEDPAKLDCMVILGAGDLVQQASFLLSPAKRNMIVEWMRQDQLLRDGTLQPRRALS